MKFDFGIKLIYFIDQLLKKRLAGCFIEMFRSDCVVDSGFRVSDVRFVWNYLRFKTTQTQLDQSAQIRNMTWT